MIIGSGYCLHLITLFSVCKFLIQCIHPSFLGTMKDGEVHSLSFVGAKTPISTRGSNFVLNIFRCTRGTGYGHECTSLALGTVLCAPYDVGEY